MPGKRQVRGKELAGRVRWGFIRALKNVKEANGIGIAEMWQDEIAEHGLLRSLDTLSRFCPKELDVEARIDTPFAFLAVAMETGEWVERYQHETQALERDSDDGDGGATH